MLILLVITLTCILKKILLWIKESCSSFENKVWICSSACVCVCVRVHGVEGLKLLLQNLMVYGTSLGIHWLRLHFPGQGMSLIPVWVAKIPHAL